MKIHKDEGRMPWLELPVLEVTHKKTGNKYMLVCTNKPVLDCTNSRDGTEVVIYYRDGRLFVRESSEFEEKFER